MQQHASTYGSAARPPASNDVLVPADSPSPRTLGAARRASGCARPPRHQPPPARRRSGGPRLTPGVAALVLVLFAAGRRAAGGEERGGGGDLRAARGRGRTSLARQGEVRDKVWSGTLTDAVCGSAVCVQHCVWVERELVVLCRPRVLPRALGRVPCGTWHLKHTWIRTTHARWYTQHPSAGYAPRSRSPHGPVSQ